MKTKIFISSVQKEFAEERRTLKAYIQGDALLNRFFEVFLFEDAPASDRKAKTLYLEEVRRSGLYLALLGNQYGVKDSSGLSSTHHEFNEATRLGKPRFIFVKGADDKARDPKMRVLVSQVGKQLIRRRFDNSNDLNPAVYASLVDYLESSGLPRFGPFDAAICRDAAIKDLSVSKIRRFVAIAREARAFPLPSNASTKQILTHLNLLHHDKPTHAAILLFGHKPQRFLISSEIKCAHFHGTEVQKPIPFYQTYKGTIFDLVDQAVDFVLSKINLAVGTREHSTQAPVEYEMPPEVVREAIVNAVAHRDYTSNGSVQVMLFSDRLEVWNPGTLPPSLTLEKLRHPHGSVPGNPLIAEPLYLTKYIERMGTGTGDMIARCRKAGLKEPEFKLTDGFVITLRRKPVRAFEAVGGKTLGGRPTQSATQSPTQSIDPVLRLLLVLEQGDYSAGDLRSAIKIKHRPTFRSNYLHPALKAGFIKHTLPGKPNSRLQKYHLTEKGLIHLKKNIFFKSKHDN